MRCGAAAKARVTLVFDPSSALRERLAADGFDLDPGEEGSIVREMSDAGRTSVRLCGRPSTAAYVREMASSIAEIVGQFEAQRLLGAGVPSRTCSIVLQETTRYDCASGRARARATHRAFTGARSVYKGDERRARERYDDAIFAVREIEDVRSEAG